MPTGEFQKRIRPSGTITAHNNRTGSPGIKTCGQDDIPAHHGSLMFDGPSRDQTKEKESPPRTKLSHTTYSTGPALLDGPGKNHQSDMSRQQNLHAWWSRRHAATPATPFVFQCSSCTYLGGLPLLARGLMTHGCLLCASSCFDLSRCQVCHPANPSYPASLFVNLSFPSRR
jgi:hypothetical protein